MRANAARRIVILGCAGVGKTTFSRRLGARLNAPVICLDQIWDEEAHVADLDAFRRLVAEAHSGEAWVSEGNFAQATFDISLPKADLIVWLEAPRWVCMWRAARRTLRSYEPHRPRGIRRVWRFILGFYRKNRPLIEALRLKHGPDLNVLTLRSKDGVERFINQLGPLVGSQMGFETRSRQMAGSQSRG